MLSSRLNIRLGKVGNTTSVNMSSVHTRKAQQEDINLDLFWLLLHVLLCPFDKLVSFHLISQQNEFLQPTWAAFLRRDHGSPLIWSAINTFPSRTDLYGFVCINLLISRDLLLLEKPKCSEITISGTKSSRRDKGTLLWLCHKLACTT